jgi:hypothetical protein
MIMLSGAGGVGKTTTIDLLRSIGLFKSNPLVTHTVFAERMKEAYPSIFDGSLSYELLGSITREFYAFKGIQNEPEGLAQDEKAQYDFQIELFQFYLERTEEKLQKAEEEKVDVIITDRSPLDYIAWTIYRAPKLLILDEIENMIEEATELLTNYDTDIVYFPYPQAWSHNEGTSTTDNFRADYPAKNFTLAALIQTLIFDWVEIEGINCYHMLETTLEGRAARILELSIASDDDDFFDELDALE